MNDLMSIVDWSRAQFALTAMYHWLFVPLTLGLGLIVAIMETVYYRTKDERWKKIEKFWMLLFGINFAIGVATGIILEFEFGTNWSNYSWFVGDIFGAPLAIEGILAFFMESTFIAVMFFGWNKVSRGFHLTSTWLTVIGATISALWILIANAWMQYPVGMEFNPADMRNEMTSFIDVVLSPIAIFKFTHTVISSWALGGMFVIGISCWFLLKKRDTEFALSSIKVAAWVGLVGILAAIWSGDSAALQTTEKQPMKLAAMEGLYNGSEGQSLTLIGVINEKKSYANDEPEFDFSISLPHGLSLLATHRYNAFVPGINDIVNGYSRDKDGNEINTVSYAERIAMGKKAHEALRAFDTAKIAGDTIGMTNATSELKANYKYFGYGYFNDVSEAIPDVSLVFYAFRVMVYLGGYFLLFFIVMLILVYRNKLQNLKWLHTIGILSIPLAWLCSESGWIVAEMGRQPWIVQNLLPTRAAISSISVSSVQLTFWLFAIVFTVLLIAEMSIMLKAIKTGPEKDDNKRM